MAERTLRFFPREISNNTRKTLRDISHVSLWLDDYQDIFSDFDPRPYAERALSDDFLTEAKKEFKETRTGDYELHLLIPKNKRKKLLENIIKKRLHYYFQKQSQRLVQKRNKVIRQGALFISAGILCMFLTAHILLSEEHNFNTTFLTVIMEPGGWFLFWEGLSLLVFKTQEQKSDMEFNEKVAKSKITFQTY